MTERPRSARRVVIAAVAIAVVPVYLLVDVAAAFAGGWWTSSSTWQAVVGISAVALLIDALLLATRRGRRVLAARGAAITLCIGTFVVTGVLADTVVEAGVRPSSLYHRYTPGNQQVFTPFPEHMPGVSGEARHTANALGLRGSDPPPRDEAYRVLCVGGSTTACIYLDDRETWPQVLGEALRAGGDAVWIADAGRNGYGTWHHVRLLEHPELIAEMDCLLFLVGINDFLRVVQGRSLHSPLGVQPLWERSAIYTVLHNAYQVRKQRRQHLEETKSGDTYPIRRRNRQRMPVTDELPDLAAGLAEYRTNLRTLIRGCRELGVVPLFATQPVLYREKLGAREDALLWLGGVPDGTVLSPAALRRGMDRFNAELRAVCAEENVGCIDLAPLSGRPELFYDDCHFTEAGAAAVGRLLAEGWRAVGPATNR